MANPWEMNWGADQAQQAAPAAGAPASGANPWDMQWDNQPSVAADVAKSAAVSPVKAAIGVAGMGGDLTELIKLGGAKIAGLLKDKLSLSDQQMQSAHDFFSQYETPESQRLAARSGARGDVPGSYELPTSADVRGQVEKVTGPLYDPKTTPGKYADTTGQFVTTALTGPQNLAKNIIKRGIAPGVASETAGEATAGTPLEPWARGGAALVGGATASALTRPGTAERAIRSQLPSWVTDAHVSQAESLIHDAAGKGVNLTWPEALSQVTGQPVLTNMQRLVESAPQSRDKMEEFFGKRPGEVAAAAQPELGAISPATNAPSTIGPAVAHAAEGTITDIRAAINRATRPSYDAAGQTLVPQSVHAAMIGDPLFQEALDSVRGNAAKTTNPNASQAVASATGTLGTDVKDIAVAADKAATVGPSSYEAALARQTALREKYLNPVLAGPLGKLADQPDTKRAIAALFPANPLANSHEEISTAVSALAQRNPWAARQLVRAHLEQEFDAAFNAAGRGQEAAQFAGARFGLNVGGSPVVETQRFKNLQAAIEALPNGQQIWPGFNRFLDIVQATGTRAPKGSLTSFNTRELEKMSTGNLVENVVKHGASPGEWWHIVHDAMGRWQLGRNLNELASIATDPRAGDLLRKISRVDPGSSQAGAMAARLIALNAGSIQGRPQPQQQKQ